MTPAGDRARFRAVDAAPGIAFALLYLMTLSRTLSITHDSALFLWPIETLHPTLHPNHLWFEPVMVSAYRLMMLAWPDIGAHRATEAVNAFAGALALQAAYAIGVWRIGLERDRAARAVACAGFTYGVWYYSIAIEAYSLPLALTAWAFFGLSAPTTRWRVVIVCAIAHALAVLCHQSAVLFGVVAMGALLSTGNPWRRRLVYSSAYALIVVTLVGSAYVAAVISTGHGQRVGQAARWSLGFLPQRSFWARPPRAFVRAAVGATRAMVGGQYVYAIPQLSAVVDQVFPRNDRVEERFFVRMMAPSLAWLFAGLSGLALAALGALIAMTAVTLWANGFRDVGRETALLAVWLAIYCAFFTLWDPTNPDFWVVQVYLAPLLAMAVLGRVGLAPVQSALFLILATSLIVVNGMGTVRLARDPANDYYTVYLRSVGRDLGPDDTLILGDHWPIRTHLDRRSIGTLYLSEEIMHNSSAALAAQVKSRLEAGRRVFVAPDILKVSRVTQASYGRHYVRFVEELRGRVCGLSRPLAGADEMPFRQVTCFDGLDASPPRVQ